MISSEICTFPLIFEFMSALKDYILIVTTVKIISSTLTDSKVLFRIDVRKFEEQHLTKPPTIAMRISFIVSVYKCGISPTMHVHVNLFSFPCLYHQV